MGENASCGPELTQEEQVELTEILNFQHLSNEDQLRYIYKTMQELIIPSRSAAIKAHFINSSEIKELFTRNEVILMDDIKLNQILFLGKEKA